VNVDVIANAGNRLWKELVGNATNMKVSSVQLSFTGIDTAEAGQQTIEGFLQSKPTSKRPREPSPQRHEGRADDISGERVGESTLTYSCPRCKRELKLKTDAVETDEIESLHAILKMEHDDWHFAQDLAREDASASSISGQQAPVGQSGQASKPKKRRKEKEKVGIEKFFSKK